MQIRFIPTAAIVAVAVLASLLAACKPGGGAAPVELGNYENAIQVTPTLDEARAVTQIIGFDGGSISATAADGTVFTLSIPADSVRQRTRITLTPVSRLDGLPFGNGTDVTVDLHPSGLMFDVPATLTIEPATPIPAGERILYGYSDNRLLLAEPVLKAQGIAIVVPHFSGYGVARGLMGNVEEARKRIGGSAEERIHSEMRAVLQEAREAEMRGEPTQNLNALLDPYFEQLDREVIQPRLAAAGQSCAAGRSAILTVLDYARQRELLGYEDPANTLDEVGDLLENTVAPKCMDEEYAMCTNEHIVHRIAMAYLGFDRQLELLGIENSPVLEKMKNQVESCLHFDLEFKVDTRFEFDTRSTNHVYLSYAEGTELSAEVAFNLEKTLSSSGTPFFEPSSGPMESLNPVHRQMQLGASSGCVPGTVSGWSDTGHFLAMDLGIDPADMSKGGGGVNSIEVTLELPSPKATISGITCGGITAPPAAWTGLAPIIFKDIHGDSILRDWKIQGSQTQAGKGFASATSEWKASKPYPPAGFVEYDGKATLRHTPR